MIDLLRTTKFKSCMLEFTTGCNLRCTYCAVSQPNWQPKNLTNIDSIIDSLIKHGVQTIIMHGHGETTIYKNWEIYANKLLDAGLQVTICTNLIKDFTKSELQTLSRLTSITVSIDTVDPDLFGKLRVRGNIRSLLYNMSTLNSMADIKWIWSSVVCDATIYGIKQLVEFGYGMGVRIFCLCNFSRISDNIDLRHISDMPIDDLVKISEIFADLAKYSAENGLLLDIKQGLLETLKYKLDHA